jgi:predicted nucleotidyltransferase
MRPSEALSIHRTAIREIVESNKAYYARVFGSVLTGEDTESSDLDVLVEPTSETTLFDLARIQLQLKELLGIKVQVLTPNGLPDSFREAVLLEAIPI